MAVTESDAQQTAPALRIARLTAAVGAVALAGSLFLVWSHQLPPAERSAFPPSVLVGIPANPDAFQVYAIADLVLGFLAAGILAAGLWGRRPARACAAAAATLGLVFVIHAGSVPPTNGVLLATGTGANTHYVTDLASAGAGETLALLGLLAAVIALAASLVPALSGD